jgi:protein PsiE
MEPVKHSSRLLRWVEIGGLVVIAVATVIAMGQEIGEMISIRTVRLADLLLLFIYLEVVAMVGAYLKSGALPVRMPLYIAIVALARYIVLDVKSMDDLRLIAVSSSILVIAIGVLVIRYGHSRYPYQKDDVISDGQES